MSKVRNTKGDPYPPKTIQQILSGYLLDRNPSENFKFMDRKNVFRKACDTVYRMLMVLVQPLIILNHFP